MLQQGRGVDAKKPGAFILNKLGSSSADMRTSMSSVSPARGGSAAYTSQSISEFGGSPSVASSSQESSRGLG